MQTVLSYLDLSGIQSHPATYSARALDLSEHDTRLVPPGKTRGLLSNTSQSRMFIG